ncbi:Sugar phosphate permease [Faunimonas pinastri]|uniref:Sugar phosphate permease n=1 Tax=Faunimonas pinastri TaxID=1855383 RepID=A0A1H9EFC2_9HYPH|nr:MFS transporter [Faunimonas pinastri]SEQ24371.1 Sugar phosphate permease [Faunimonas pinastri]
MPDVATFEGEVVRKVAWRLMPFLTLGYFLASLDRVNVGFAALQMNGDIGLSSQAFGFGAGLFFVAYCFFAVPGNLIMQRVGARLWLSVTMIAWGVISAATACVQGPTSFAVLRFLLGIAEAGFFPGVIYYFTLWFPANHRSRMVAILMMALPVSSVVGSPVSAALLLSDGFMGLRGWHWLFIIEGLPAALIGLACALVLPRNIQSAGFLSPPQKAWLADALRESPTKGAVNSEIPLWRVLINKYVLVLTLIYIGGTSVTNALSLWQPQIIKTYALSTFHVGLLNSLPFALASLAMYLWASHSDRTGERPLHTALPLALAGVALICTTFVQGLAPMIGVLCVVIICASMIKGPFWAMATEALPSRLSAVAIGQINALNNLGVFGATWVIGAIRGATGSFTFAMLPIAALTLSACVAALWMGHRQRRPQQLAKA